MAKFSPEITERVLAHMNDDHSADSLLIVRAYGSSEASSARMIDVDTAGGVWQVTSPAGEHEVRIAWPGGEISEREEIRREVVVLFEEAHKRLGLPVPEKQEAGHAHGGEHAHGAGHHGGYHGTGHGHGSSPHGHGSYHGGNPHSGANPHGGRPTTKRKPLGPDAGFADVVRDRSWDFHTDSEGSKFMIDIMSGTATKDDYVALIIEHYFIYKALEKAADLLADDSATAGFDSAELRRVAAIESDLEFLLGSDWASKIEPSEATKAYCARIDEVAAAGWLPAIVAHHYTRYLGDLSGGQMIAKKLRDQHGFTHDGVRFYEFAELGPLGKFKVEYREQLDALGASLSEADRERFIAEVQRAYEHNTAIFNDLQASRS
ncbi:MAG: biliverdin-producing heme oxygenase [Microbacteriaceae bacterium]|nr:biliverdin-producing heme oxygenase [Microbacteriaceae bacterium]